MNYYRLNESDDLPNILIPEFPSATTIWSETEPVFLNGKVGRDKEYIYFLPFYRSGILSKAYLVAAELWEIWREFQEGGRCRPCAFGHLGTRQVKPYYFLLPQIIEALHEDTTYQRDGSLDYIVLSKVKIGMNQVFVVKGSTEMELIISEDVLEEMLRSNISCLKYEQVEVRGD